MSFYFVGFHSILLFGLSSLCPVLKWFLAEALTWTQKCQPVTGPKELIIWGIRLWSEPCPWLLKCQWHLSVSSLVSLNLCLFHHFHLYAPEVWLWSKSYVGLRAWRTPYASAVCRQSPLSKAQFNVQILSNKLEEGIHVTVGQYGLLYILRKLF